MSLHTSTKRWAYAGISKRVVKYDRRTRATYPRFGRLIGTIATIVFLGPVQLTFIRKGG